MTLAEFIRTVEKSTPGEVSRLIDDYPDLAGEYMKIIEVDLSDRYAGRAITNEDGEDFQRSKDRGLEEVDYYNYFDIEDE